MICTRSRQDLIKKILEEFEYEVIVAEDGLKTLEKYKQHEEMINLIVMDIQMPMMDGLEVTRTIRNLEKKEGKERMSIIALTGKAMKEDRKICLDAGCDDYFTKPIEIPEFIAAIGRLIPKKEE